MIYLFFIAIAYFFFKDVRRAIIAYAPFKFFFISGTVLVWKIDFDVAVSLLAYVLYLSKYKIKLKTIPWGAGIVVSLACYTLHCLYPSPHLLVLMQRIFIVEIYAILFFCSIRSMKDVQLFMKSIAVYAALLVGNGLVEFVTGSNLLGDLQANMLRVGTFLSENELERFLGRRVRSFVPHSIGFGVECACLLFLLAFVKLRTRLLPTKQTVNILLLCLAFGILISGSRTPLLGSVLFLVPFVFGINKKNPKYLFMAFIGFVAVYFVAGDYIATMFGSLLSGSSSHDVSGSSVDMRQVQMEYSLYVFWQNPIWGQGPDFDIFSAGERYEIMGAESIWFPILMKQGIIGIVGYAFTYLVFIKNVFHSQFKYFLIFFIIGWLVIDSASNLPGITFFFPLMIATVVYKIDALKLYSGKIR